MVVSDGTLVTSASGVLARSFASCTPSPRRTGAIVLQAALLLSSGAAAFTLQVEGRGYVEGVACSECGIDIVESRRFGTGDGPGMITGEMTLGVRDGLGRTLVWDFEAGVVQVFSANGSITRVLGGLGEGPGQFRVIDAVRVADDGSIWVFDQVNSRATVYSTELELRETIRFETAPSYAVELLPNRQTLLSKTIRTRERFGYLLHVVDGDGNLTESIGNPDAIVHPGLPGSFAGRHLASSATGGFWTVHPTEYRIRRWHLDGTTDRDITRVADWFLTGPERFDLSFEKGLPAGVLAVREGADGLLWVLVRVADANWRDSLRGRRTNGEPIFGGAREDIYDVIVEVINPDLRRVVASARLPQWITGFVEDGVLGGIVHDGLDMYFQTWNVALKKTPA